jgi:urease accessory protein
MKFRTALTVLALSAVFASTAAAHPGHDHDLGPGIQNAFAAGLFHPLFGLDHLLAMFAVGLLAAQLGGRALWALPAAFVGLMVFGGAAGMAGYSLPANEIFIAISVVVLGLALAVGMKYPLVAAAMIVGCFGILHGHAHGGELPNHASPLLYSCGFVAATAALHLGGIGAGLLLMRSARFKTLVRASGAAISAVGLVMLVMLMI